MVGLRGNGERGRERVERKAEAPTRLFIQASWRERRTLRAGTVRCGTLGANADETVLQVQDDNIGCPKGKRAMRTLGPILANYGLQASFSGSLKHE